MHYRRLAILLLLVALLVAASFWDPVYEPITRFLERAKPFIRQHDVLGVFLFIILSATSAMAFFFSTAVVLPVAVYSWGKPLTIFLIWISWLLGAAAAYWIGRHPGRRVAKWLIPARGVKKYEKKISANATFPMILLFQAAVPSEIPGYVLGALRYHFGRFLAAFAIVEIPFAIGAVYLGDSFVRRQYVLLIIIGVGGILFSTAALYFLNKRINK